MCIRDRPGPGRARGTRGLPPPRSRLPRQHPGDSRRMLPSAWSPYPWSLRAPSCHCTAGTMLATSSGRQIQITCDLRSPTGTFGLTLAPARERRSMSTNDRCIAADLGWHTYLVRCDVDDFGVPANYVPGLRDNLTDDVFVHAEQAPEQVGFSRRVDGRWVPVTYRAVSEQVTGLAAGLIASGVQAGDRVALFSGTRFEWMLCDFAIWTGGGVTVPVYETSSAEQVEWILADSGAVAAFVETQDHAQTVAQAQVGLPELRDVWVIDSGGIGELVAAGCDVTVETVTQRRREVVSDSLATIIYTSGTTGRPKGCAITHASLLCEVHNVCAAEGITERVFNEDTRALHFLPLAHILARVIPVSYTHNRVCLL